MDDLIDLPLSPGAPWLLGFAVRSGAEPDEQLAPERPWVAVHPGPLTTPTAVDLTFFQAGPTGVPLLSALPALCRGR